MGLPKKRKFFIRSQNLMRKVWRHFGKIRRYYFREVLGSYANFTADESLMSFSQQRGKQNLLNKKSSFLKIQR